MGPEGSFRYNAGRCHVTADQLRLAPGRFASLYRRFGPLLAVVSVVLGLVAPEGFRASLFANGAVLFFTSRLPGLKGNVVAVDELSEVDPFPPRWPMGGWFRLSRRDGDRTSSLDLGLPNFRSRAQAASDFAHAVEVMRVTGKLKAGPSEGA